MACVCGTDWMANVPHALAGFRLQLVTPSLNRPGQQHQGQHRSVQKKSSRPRMATRAPRSTKALILGSSGIIAVCRLEIQRSFEMLKHPHVV